MERCDAVLFVNFDLDDHLLIIGAFNDILILQNSIALDFVFIGVVGQGVKCMILPVLLGEMVFCY